MTKRTLLVVLALALSLTAGADRARADGPTVVRGSWAGTAYANPEFDIDGDGVSGRQFDFRALGQLPFSGVEGALDSHVDAVGSCAGPGSISLRPLGTITLRGRLGDSLYATFDPAAPDICLDPANPGAPEVVRVLLAGGSGAFAGATGTGTFTIRDVVRLSRPVALPGIGTVQAPTMIDSHGDFAVSIN